MGTGKKSASYNLCIRCLEVIMRLKTGRATEKRPRPSRAPFFIACYSQAPATQVIPCRLIVCQINHYQVVISFFVLHQGCTIMGKWFSSIPDCSVEYFFHSLEIRKMLLPEDKACQVHNRK